MSYQALLLKILKERKEGRKIVFTNGCFDLLHLGHIRYLYEAKKYGDILVVGINSDRSVKLLKGEYHPIISELERSEMIQSLKPVNYSIIFDELTPEKLIREIKPHIHVKGGDYSMDEIPESKIMNEIGGKTIIVPLIPGKSSTAVIQKIISLYR